MALDKNSYEVVKITKKRKAWLQKPHLTGVGSSLFRTIVFLYKGVVYRLTLKLARDKDYIDFARGMLEHVE